MNPAPQLRLRDSIVELLSDAETAQLSNAESATHLTEGDEFIDLAKPEDGVLRAHGELIRMENVLPRTAVQKETWKTITKLLSSALSGAPKHTGH